MRPHKVRLASQAAFGGGLNQAEGAAPRAASAKKHAARLPPVVHTAGVRRDRGRPCLILQKSPSIVFSYAWTLFAIDLERVKTPRTPFTIRDGIRSTVYHVVTVE